MSKEEKSKFDIYIEQLETQLAKEAKNYPVSLPPITDVEIEILIKSLEAFGKSLSIAQKWQLSALYELRCNREEAKKWLGLQR